MKQLQGAPYNESVVVAVETEATDDRARIDPHVDVVLFSTPDIELLLPLNPRPGQSLTIVAFVDAAVENLNGVSFGVPAGAILSLAGGNGTWTAGRSAGLQHIFVLSDPVVVPNLGINVWTTIATVVIPSSEGRDLRYQAYVAGVASAGPSVISARILDTPDVGAPVIIAGAAASGPGTGNDVNLSILSQKSSVPAGRRTVELQIETFGSTLSITPADASHQGATLLVEGVG